MGAADARLFVTEGAKVVLVDVLEAEGQQLARELDCGKGHALYVHLHVTQAPNWD